MKPLNLGLARGGSFGVLPKAPPPLHVPSPVSEEDTFLAWLFRQADLRARDYRGLALRRRLPACFRALRVDGIASARRALRREAKLVPVALDALLLGVTEFFRDSAVFDRLGREFAALASAESDRPLRLWSAACSDGAEMYSVAMMLAELGLAGRAELLGTDCRPEAVAHAAAGVFAPIARRGLSPHRFHQHFDAPAFDGRARVSRELRERITWRQADVLAGAEAGPWDVILCRNMAMYLRPSAAERLWQGLAGVLRPGGLLVLGKAERPTGPAASSFSSTGPCVYRRGGGA